MYPFDKSIVLTDTEHADIYDRQYQVIRQITPLNYRIIVSDCMTLYSLQ